MNGRTAARRLRQTGAVAAIELRRLLASKRSASLYVLAALPVVLAGLIGASGATDSAAVNTFHKLILGTSVFFGCALVFTNLFRREILEQSLHFFLLAPIRREALLAGKYLAGVAAAAMLFGAATAIAYPLLWLPFGGGAPFDQAARLGADLFVVVLACAAYGALFTLFGLLFRNPTLPVAALLGLEVMHFVLPPALQAASVVHYLKALASVPPPPVGSLFAVLAPVPTPGVAVASLLAIMALGLVASGWRLRRLQLAYSDD